MNTRGGGIVLTKSSAIFCNNPANDTLIGSCSNNNKTLLLQNCGGERRNSYNLLGGMHTTCNMMRPTADTKTYETSQKSHRGEGGGRKRSFVAQNAFFLAVGEFCHVSPLCPVSRRGFQSKILLKRRLRLCRHQEMAFRFSQARASLCDQDQVLLAGAVLCQSSGLFHAGWQSFWDKTWEWRDQGTPDPWQEGSGHAGKVQTLTCGLPTRMSQQQRGLQLLVSLTI